MADIVLNIPNSNGLENMIMGNVKTADVIDAKKYGLGWIFKQTKGVRWYLAIFTVMILIATGLEVSFAFFLKEFVDIATGDSNSSLLNVGLLSGAVLVIVGIVSMLSSIVSKYIYGKTERNIRSSLLDVIFSRRMVDISKHHTGDLLTKLTLDTQAVSEIFPSIIRNMVGGAAAAVIAVVSMFLLDWRMALIVLGLTPILMFAMGVLTPFIEKASGIDKKNDEDNRTLMQENLSRIMLIKTYFMQKKTIANVKAMYAKKLRSGMNLGKWEGLTMFAGMLLSMSMFLITIGVGSYFVLRGETTLGSLVAIVQLLNYVVNPVAKFAETISLISQATASSGRIGTVIEIPADNGLNKASSVSATGLIAENISFTYDKREDAEEGEQIENGAVLEDVGAVFQKGAVTGLAGKSGSGKSTLLKLLIGLYEPQQGSVSLNHENGVINGEQIMPYVAYVPPVDYLFSGTVLDNIVMAEDEPDIVRVEQAARDANILDFIETLPQKFDTIIGESGGTVSSGQAQRIAIARAIYKNSPLLVFDEPTANLDVQSIEIFQSAIKRICDEKICIVVTHDESTKTVCDKVYNLEDGYVSVQNEYASVG